MSSRIKGRPVSWSPPTSGCLLCGATAP
jgi:hypothetical protein